MTDLEWLDAAPQRRSVGCLDARDLEEFRGALIADVNLDELVAPGLAMHSGWTSPEP